VVIYHPSPQIPATPNLPSLSLGSNTKENPDETAERNNTDKDKNRYCLYTRQIVDLMRPWVNHWLMHLTVSPLAGQQQPHAACRLCGNPPHFCI